MKKTLLFFALVLCMFNGFSQAKKATKPNQVKAKTAENPYSNWLFIQGDKALQYRFKLVKQEGDVGYFQVQFKINFEDPIFCKHPTCEGYLLVFGYPSLDNQNNIDTSYKFYNTFKGVYTRPELVPLKLSFPDGSKRFLKQEGFFYTLAGSDAQQPASYLFGNCVDDILSNNPKQHRCKPYGPTFKEAEAITVK